MTRWFNAKPWQMLERGAVVDGDCSVDLVESHEGMSIVFSERVGAGTHLTRAQALLEEEDWDRLAEAITRWRATESGGGIDARCDAGSDLEASELLRLLVGLKLSHAAGAVGRCGERAAGWLAVLAQKAVDGAKAER